MECSEDLKAAEGRDLNLERWRRVWDLNPRGPMDHRLSRPAPYQARVTRPNTLPLFLSLLEGQVKNTAMRDIKAIPTDVAGFLYIDMVHKG